MKFYADIVIMCLLVAFVCMTITGLVGQEIRVFSIIGVGVCYYQVTRSNEVFSELKEKWAKDLKK